MTPLHRAWTDGVIAGLREYAWWKDGTQYVGSCGTTLKTAIARAESVWADEPDDPVTCFYCGCRVLCNSVQLCDSCRDAIT